MKKGYELKLLQLEKKYPAFEYFNSFDGWVFKIDNFEITFELKNETEVKELISDENFINWLDEQFKEYMR